MIRVRRIVHLLLAVFMFVSLPAFADQDGAQSIPGYEYRDDIVRDDRNIPIRGNVYHDRDFYIPYMPGAKDCYGAYRLISHTATYNISKIDGTLDYTLNEPVAQKSSKRVNDIFQIIDMVRSDVVVFTDFFKVEKERQTYSGDKVYDRYYYEVPSFIIGYYLDTSPVFGSSVISDIGRPYFVVMDIENMAKIFKGNTKKEAWQETIQKALINFQGTNPKGQVIRKSPSKYVISQSPSHVVLGWWEELSQEFIRSLESDDAIWTDISDVYDEMAFKNGKFLSSVPVYRTSPDIFLSFDKMRKLWTDIAESKKNVPNPFPKHFTDAMRAGSPGTWHNDAGTLISHDPNLLAMWVFQVNKVNKEPLQENLQVKASNIIPTDFSVLKNVDDKLYRFVAPAGDPNLLFAFAPFDDSLFYYKSGAYVFFPYEERYRSSELEDLDIRDTLEDLPGIEWNDIDKLLKKLGLDPDDNISKGDFYEMYRTDPERLKKLKEFLDTLENLWKKEKTSIIKTLKNKNLGHGAFKDNSDTYIYEVAGCYFVPANRAKLLSSLKSGPFSDVVKKFNIPAFGYPFGVSGAKAALKEW